MWRHRAQQRNTLVKREVVIAGLASEGLALILGSAETGGSVVVGPGLGRSVTELERWQRRATSNIDSLKLFATRKEAYPLICMIQKCFLACPPSQSDCEELFSLLGLFQGYIHVLYVCEVDYTCWLRTKLTLGTKLTCTFRET